MHRSKWILAALSCTLIQGCSTEVAATNPYDPESLTPAPGSLGGRIEAPTLESPQGIRVHLLEGSSAVPAAMTDTDGAFLFPAIQRGHYKLEIREEGFQTLVLHRLEVPQGGHLDLGTLTLVPLTQPEEVSEIEGLVTLEGLSVHGGIHIRAIGRPFETFTRPDGSWQLFLPEGRYDIELSHSDYQTHVYSAVRVDRGEKHVLEPVVLLAEPATIAGTVSRRTCAPDPSEELELPATDAIVTAIGTGQTALVDESGTFAVTGLPAGVYTLRVTMAGHDSAQVSGLAVRGGELLQLPDPVILPSSKGSIVGRVTASGEADHSGTVVQLSGTGFAGFTVDDGAFRIADVCAGPGYQLSATRPAFITGSVGGIDVPAGGTVTAPDLVLARQHGGFVLNEGRPFTGAQDRVVAFTLNAPSLTTQMRMSEEDSLFVDPDRSEEGWIQYAPEGTFELSAGEGTKRVLAQVRGSGAASEVLEARVVLDLTPPTEPRVMIEDGGPYSNDPDGVLLLTLTAADTPAEGADSASGVALVEILNFDLQSGEAPPSTSDDPAWDDAPPLPYSRTLLHPLLRPQTDEEKEVWVRFGDEAGNWSVPISARVILDRQPPEHISVSIVGSASGFANSQVVTLQLTAVDENPGISMRLANDSTFTGAAWTSFADEIPWLLAPGDGPKEVWAQFRDAAGNVTQAIGSSITLDTKPPTGARLAIQEAPYSPVREVTLLVSGQDAAEMIFSLQPDFTNDEGLEEQWLPFDQVHSITLPESDGEYVVYGKLRDAALNETDRLEAPVVLDRTPPVVASVSIAEGSHVPAPQVTLLTTAIPGERDAHEMRVDVVDVASSVRTEGAFGPYNASQALSLPAPAGEKLVEVFLRDAAGNISPEPGSVPVTYDPDPPIIHSVTIAGGADFTADLESLLEIDATGAAEMQVSNRADFAGSVWQPFVAGIYWSLPPSDGLHTVHLRLRDLAGNIASASTSISLDRAGPIATAVHLDGGATYSRTGVVDILLEALDTGSGLTQVSISNEPSFAGATIIPWPAGSESVTYTGWALALGDGLRTVHARFHDAVGNTTSNGGSILVDTTPPTNPAIAIQPAPYTGSRDVTAELSVNGAFEMCLYGDLVGGSIDDCEQTGWEPLLTSEALTLSDGDGPKQVHVVYRDQAGWVTSPVTATVLLDRTPPDVGDAEVTLTGVARLGPSNELTRVANVTVDLSGFPCADAPVPDLSGLVDMRISEDAAFSGATWQPFTSSFGWVLTSGDGSKTLYVQARDGAGNISEAVTGSIDLDQTPPTGGALLMNDGATFTTTTAVTLTFWVGGDAVEWSLDGGQSWSACSLPICAPTGPGESHPHSLAAGDGLKMLQMNFRDDAGNVSETFTSSIFLDSTPPDISASSLNLISPTNNGFTNSVSVDVSLIHPAADATHMRVAAAGGASCAPSDMTGVVPQPIAGTFTFLLPPGDGQKTLCARLIDAAGNESGFISGGIVLDTVPPTTPQIVTPSQVVSLAEGSQFAIEIAAPVSDTNFWRYEQLGGQAASWTAVAGEIGTTSFTFQLMSNNVAGRPESGVPNLLRLRAVDKAGNVSPEASVVVTADVVPPSPVVLDQHWVRNASGKATVHWQPSQSPDVVGYNVYYGTSSASLTGIHANEGLSPIFVGNQTSAVLSGLIDGEHLYVTVRPVDHAGLEGDSPPGGSWSRPDQLVSLLPNEVPLNLIHSFPVSDERTWLNEFARYDDHLYAVATTACQHSPLRGHTLVYAFDMSRIVSPIQGGEINPQAPGPTLTWSDSFDDSLRCGQFRVIPPPGRRLLVIDGHWMFLASGSRLRIYDVLVPSSPVLRAMVDFDPVEINALVVRGPTAFMAGHYEGDPEGEHGRVIALDLSKLYSNDYSGWIPVSLSDEIGRVGASTQIWEGFDGIMWTRDRLVVRANTRDGQQTVDDDLYAYRISNALAADSPTFDQGDFLGRSPPLGTMPSWGDPFQSGNYGYFASGGQLTVVDLTSLWLHDTGDGPLDDLYSSTIFAGGHGAWGSPEVAGGQAFLRDQTTTGTRGYDLASPPLMKNVAFYYRENSPRANNLVYGNLLFADGPSTSTTQSSNVLQVFEIGSPVSLSLRTSTSGSGMLHEIEGGLLFSSDGTVLDLQSGSIPQNLGPFSNTLPASRGVAAFEDATVVAARDGFLRIFENDRIIDRNHLTTPQFGDGIYDLTFPQDIEATGVARHGSYLIVSQRRSDGIWLEVFDATPLRNRLPTVLDESWSRGDFQVSTTVPHGSTWAVVRMHRGRAIVTIDGGPSGEGGFVIADLRPLLDDDPSTVMTPDHLQASLRIDEIRDSVVVGEHAYIAGRSHLYVLDVSAAFDENLATEVTSTPLQYRHTNNYGITATGSHLLVSSLYGLHVYDIRDPALPILINHHGGLVAGGYYVRHSLSVLGSRIYATHTEGLYIYDLH